MSRLVSVQRLFADILFARATSPEAGLDADVRDLAEEPERSSAFLFFMVIVELICLALVLGPVPVLAAVATGATMSALQTVPARIGRLLRRLRLPIAADLCPEFWGRHRIPAGWGS